MPSEPMPEERLQGTGERARAFPRAKIAHAQWWTEADVIAFSASENAKLQAQLAQMREALRWCYSEATPCVKPHYEWAKEHKNDSHAPGEVARQSLERQAAHCEEIETLLNSTTFASDWMAEHDRKVIAEAMQKEIDLVNKAKDSK